MVNKLLKASVVILLLLLCLVGWLQYRQYDSWKIPIHPDAQMVFKINADACIKDLIGEYGLNFSDKLRRKNTEKKRRAKNTGVYLPANIFVYNLQSALPSTFFCTLPVYNLPDFKTYLHSQFNIVLKDSGALFTGRSADGRISILASETYIGIAYAPKKEEVLQHLKEIIAGKNILRNNRQLVAKLKQGSNHLSGATASAVFGLRFAANKILFSAALDSITNAGILPAQNALLPSSKTTSNISLAMRPTGKALRPFYDVKGYRLHTDSILKYFNGSLHLQLGAAIKQTDTITTYGYDDNFEKTQQQTVTQIDVPHLNLYIAATPALLSYLQSRHFVTPAFKVNKEVFPLYNVSVQQQNNLLLFTTGSRPAMFHAFGKTTNFLEVDVDIKSASHSLGLPQLQPYTQHITRLRATGRKNGDTIKLQGSLDFENAAIVEIVNIIKGL